jgi:GNAT superfamily N-acetyltransferase
MKIIPLGQGLVPAVMDLMALGEPFIRVRGESDYWLYGRLFSSSCPVVVDDDETVIGSAIAFRSQDEPGEIYVQDLMVHPGHRRRGVASALVAELRSRAESWGCRRIYLTSEPENAAAHDTWLHLGFGNLPGDLLIDGVSLVSDFKGVGKHRAVYELLVP